MAKKVFPTSFPIVGIGASAGGLEAFEQLLGALPSTTGMAFVLVQHLSPKRESLLTTLLSKKTPLPVTQVEDGTQVFPNHVYVIPPDAYLSLREGKLHLTAYSGTSHQHLPIDRFFRSLAKERRSRAIGVILSGTASDGTLGLRAIKEQGGITFAQDDDTARYNSMPRNAVAAGNVDFVLPPELIARELARIARHADLFEPEEAAAGEAAAVQDETLRPIFALLKNKSKVDFSLYRQGTLKRRITRRMLLRKIENLPDYLSLLRKSPEEAQALSNDLLINVTSFFRDEEAFDVLRKVAFPAMMAARLPSAPIRIWVPGCSTGEEAYSLAICLLEHLGDQASDTQIQVFATDVNEATIPRARSGIYEESALAGVSSERRRDYFQKLGSGFQIRKSIRDMCVFARQDITKDPPFSKLDLISCRNVMIYMGPILQKRIIPLFHYALNPKGILFLGSSETVGGFGELFTPLDKKHKVYRRKSVPVSLSFEFVPHFTPEEENVRPTNNPQPPVKGLELQRMADQILLNRYAPASVMVNANLDILMFIGQTGPYLGPTPGDASLNLLKMVKSGLQFELRAAFQEVKRKGTGRREGLLVENEGGFKVVNFDILPVRSPASKDQYYIVVFEEGSKAVPAKTSRPEKVRKSGKPANRDAEIAKLKTELEATREYLQSVIEEQRTTNEELRSSNEEVQSSNEALQSINEELETAKEELQSTNEELTTVNEELQNRNEELTQLNNDLNNLLSSVNIPIIMLGNDMRIRRFTPMAEKVMNLIPSDVGRPITDIKSKLKTQGLTQLVSEVIETLKIQDSEVEDRNGKWYSMRVRPYRTMDNKIDGVVILLLDRQS